MGTLDRIRDRQRLGHTGAAIPLDLYCQVTPDLQTALRHVAPEHGFEP
ncbi:MAG: hypothetical protein ACLQNU_04075 [Candidatus Dormibacteria bacterium]